MQPDNAPQVWTKPTVVLASADNGSQVEPTNGALGWLTPPLSKPQAPERASFFCVLRLRTFTARGQFRLTGPAPLIRHLKQLDNVHSQSLSKSLKAVDGDVGNAAFELRNIRAVELCHLS